MIHGKEVIYNVKGKVAYITLNRPNKRNAITTKMFIVIMEYLENANKDPNIKCIVISSVGDVFCAGADLNNFTHDSNLSIHDRLKESSLEEELFTLKKKIVKPVICQVQGISLGLGVLFIVMSHVVIASEKSEFGLPEINLGLAPLGIIPYLVSVIGLRNTMELSLTGHRVDVDTAKNWGLVHYKVNHEDLTETTSRLAEQFTKNQPLSMELIIRTLNSYESQQVKNIENLCQSFLALNYMELD